jgi:hypothetical protein
MVVPLTESFGQPKLRGARLFGPAFLILTNVAALIFLLIFQTSDVSAIRPADFIFGMTVFYTIYITLIVISIVITIWVAVLDWRAKRLLD